MADRLATAKANRARLLQLDADHKARIEEFKKNKKPAAGTPKVALLIIDVQYDFLPPSGSLAVANGEQVIDVINKMRTDNKFDVVALTQDWHPANHMSFHVNNQGKGVDLFGELKLPDGTTQVMWPAHCIQGSHGAEFHERLKIEKSDIIVQKGTNPQVDSYSGFRDNNKAAKTDLEAKLKEAGVTHVVCTGLATDYCVGSSADDSVEAGFKTYLVEDAARGVAPGTSEAKLGSCKKNGVNIIQSADVTRILAQIRGGA